MGAYYAIQSYLFETGDVIDIQGNSTKAGALLDAYPGKDPLGDNQLWEFVPDPQGSGYYFIRSKLNGYVIDIQQNSMASGAALDAYPQKDTGAGNQLWQFFLDPSGSGWYFIINKLTGNVIEIPYNSTTPGVLLDVYPRKMKGGNVGQLWSVVYGSFPAKVEAAPAPSQGLGSNYNYIFYQGCNNFVNPDEPRDTTALVVTIDVTTDMICKSWSGGSTQGFSFQLNCYSPQSSSTDWQQFAIGLSGNNLWYDINLFANPSVNPGQAQNNPYINLGQQNFLSLPDSMLPAGYQLKITLLQYPTTQLIVQANFDVLDQGKLVATAQQAITRISPAITADLAPIVACELNIVGPFGSESVVLSQGAGYITYWAPNPMSLLNGRPVCTDRTHTTAELSNVNYAYLPATPNSIFKQWFEAST